MSIAFKISFFLLSVLFLASCSIVTPPPQNIFDCFKVHVTNSADVALDVYWVADGCAGIKNGHDFVCGSHMNVASNTTTTYTFLWGTTSQKVMVQNHENSNQIYYTYYHSGNTYKLTFPYGEGDGGASGTPPNCSHNYSVTITQKQYNTYLK